MAVLTHPHWEALTPFTQEAFQQARRLEAISRFYLAGGTGLALHLGHRFSIDLDFFSADVDSLGEQERAGIRETFEDPSLSITYDQDATFVAKWRGVGISFFRLNLYPLVQEPLLVDGIRLATITEIGAMKLAAILARGTRKDLVDLYFILKAVSLQSIFEVAAVKYAENYSFPAIAIRALAYFDDAEALPMPQMIDRTPWSKMKKYLEQQAYEAGRQRLADL